MRHLKRLKTTLRSNNPFAIFTGLYLGILLAFKVEILVLIMAIAIVIFSSLRFGLMTTTSICVCLLLGFLSRYLITAPPKIDRFNTYVVIDAKDNYLLVQHGLNRYYVSLRNNPYQIGDFLRIKGQLDPIKFYHVEGQFDFQAHLQSRGVANQLVAARIEEAFLWPLRFRERQLEFLSKFDADGATYLGAILFNRRDYHSVTLQLFDGINLAHLLSSSGMLIYGHLRLVETVMTRFLDENKARKLAFLTLVPWTFFNPTAIALWRVMLSGTINLFYKSQPGQLIVYWRKKGYVGVIMLLFSRYMVYNPGFYLSFGLASCLYVLRTSKYQKTILNKILTRFLPWLFLLPYLVMTNGSIHLLGVILFIPLVIIHGWLLTLGLLQLYTWPLPALMVPIIRASQLIVSVSQYIQIQFHFSEWSSLTIIIYLLTLLLAFYISSLKYGRHVNIGIYACASFVALSILPIQNFYEASISFINVGQGDAILIKNRKAAVLVDTGGSLYIDIANTSLIPYFKRNGISKLDALIITHDDFDHAGALPTLTSKFPVMEIVTETSYFPIALGGIIFQNINHLHDIRDSNFGSLVLTFALGGYHYLLMGDAPIEVEQDIINRYPDLDCDYIKIGHHGSRTSTSDAFIKHVTPKEAIISVGRNNYGHPHPDVINRLRAHDVIIRRTDIEGTIKYKYWAS